MKAVFTLTAIAGCVISTIGVSSAGAQYYPSYPDIERPYDRTGSSPSPYPGESGVSTLPGLPYGGEGSAPSYPIPGVPNGGNIYDMLRDMQQRGRGLPTNQGRASQGRNTESSGASGYDARNPTNSVNNRSTTAAWTTADQRPYTSKANCEADSQMKSRVGGGVAWARYCSKRFGSVQQQMAPSLSNANNASRPNTTSSNSRSNNSDSFSAAAEARDAVAGARSDSDVSDGQNGRPTRTLTTGEFGTPTQRSQRDSDYSRLLKSSVRNELDAKDYHNGKYCYYAVGKELENRSEDFGDAAYEYCESRGYPPEVEKRYR